MSDASEKSRAGPEVSLVVAGVAAALVVTAVFVAPPVYERLARGGDIIESGAVRALVWMVAGALAASGLALWGLRRRISGMELCVLAGTLIVCAVVGELALTAAGVEPFKRVMLSTPGLADWWEREGAYGPRFVPERYRGRWEVNAAGYADRDEFSAEVAAVRPRRVLLLGDSFTFGASASGYEKSFAAILDRELGEETVVWNMGLGGTGQRQDLAVLEAFFPALEPQVVVLSFCLNDFQDNEYPLGAHYAFVNDKWVRAYALGEDGSPRLLSPEAAYRRAFSATESVSDLVYASRIATLAISAVRRFQQGGGGAPLEEVASETARAETQRLLGMIQQYVESRGAALRVMIIPFREHLDAQEPRYKTILEIAAELGLEVWELWPLLEVVDYAPEPDTHWNDSGHDKVGRFLADEIEAVYAER